MIKHRHTVITIPAVGRPLSPEYLAGITVLPDPFDLLQYLPNLSIRFKLIVPIASFLIEIDNGLVGNNPGFCECRKQQEHHGGEEEVGVEAGDHDGYLVSEERANRQSECDACCEDYEPCEDEGVLVGGRASH